MIVEETFNISLGFFFLLCRALCRMGNTIGRFLHSFFSHHSKEEELMTKKKQSEEQKKDETHLGQGCVGTDKYLPEILKSPFLYLPPPSPSQNHSVAHIIMNL